MPKTEQSDQKISKALRTFDRRKVTETLPRDRSIRIRVTAPESHEIKRSAEDLNVSVSDLLRQLFLHARDRL